MFPKVTWVPANNEHGHIWLNVGSTTTRVAQWLAGAQEAHKCTSRYWLAMQDGDHKHRCTNINGEKQAAKIVCSFFIVTSL